jgi:hypothetical protein
MPWSDTEERAFLTARRAIERGAFDRFQSLNPSPEAAQVYKSTPLLSDLGLLAVAFRALVASKGAEFTEASMLPLTYWTGGATDTWHGQTRKDTFKDFAAVLESRAKFVTAKRSGWVVEPTTTKSGRRTNADTLAMHALFLDCDGSGSWDLLLARLEQAGCAFVAYESGGHTQRAPKWRVVLPLSEPFDVSNDDGRQAWKDLYHHARVVYGALGHLTGEAFDPTTETPAIPWFLTERRLPSDATRRVVLRTGSSLDLLRLAVALPAAPEGDAAHRYIESVEIQCLSDDKLEEIVNALVVPMSKIRNTRRELYLALSGALCDRGLVEHCEEIVTQISYRCPGDDASKTREHIHGARTTVEKYRTEGAYTRIGTLNARWPEVAETLDLAVPDSRREEFVAMALRLMEPAGTTKQSASNQAFVPSIDTAPHAHEVAPVDHTTLRKFIVGLRRRKKKGIANRDPKEALQWVLLDRLLEGKPLCQPFEEDTVTGLMPEEALRKLAGLLAFVLPKTTPIDAVMQIVRPTITAMLPEGLLPEDCLQLVRRSYLLSLSSKLELDDKRKQQEQEKANFFRAYALNGGQL